MNLELLLQPLLEQNQLVAEAIQAFITLTTNSDMTVQDSVSAQPTQTFKQSVSHWVALLLTEKSTVLKSNWVQFWM